MLRQELGIYRHRVVVVFAYSPVRSCSSYLGTQRLRRYTRGATLIAFPFCSWKLQAAWDISIGSALPLGCLPSRSLNSCSSHITKKPLDRPPKPNSYAAASLFSAYTIHGKLNNQLSGSIAPKNKIYPPPYIKRITTRVIYIRQHLLSRPLRPQPESSHPNHGLETSQRRSIQRSRNCDHPREI